MKSPISSPPVANDVGICFGGKNKEIEEKEKHFAVMFCEFLPTIIWKKPYRPF